MFLEHEEVAHCESQIIFKKLAEDWAFLKSEKILACSNSIKLDFIELTIENIFEIIIDCDTKTFQTFIKYIKVLCCWLIQFDISAFIKLATHVNKTTVQSDRVDILIDVFSFALKTIFTVPNDNAMMTVLRLIEEYKTSLKYR